jgi:hypothetical protein
MADDRQWCELGTGCADVRRYRTRRYLKVLVRAPGATSMTSWWLVRYNNQTREPEAWFLLPVIIY